MEHKGDTCNRYRGDLLDCLHTMALLFDVASWHFLDRWHFVAAVVRGFLRKVVAQREVELPWRGRQPVGLFVRTRRLGLQVDVERPVGVELERHPRGDGVAVEAVHYVEVALVLRHGPGAVGGSELPWLETHRVLVGAVERLAVTVYLRSGIDGVFALIGAEPHVRHA